MGLKRRPFHADSAITRTHPFVRAHGGVQPCARHYRGPAPGALSFVLKHTGLKAGLAERFRRIFSVVRDADALARELIATRCHRGAEIALMLRFPHGVADGILSLDEHFNGKGWPAGRPGRGPAAFGPLV